MGEPLSIIDFSVELSIDFVTLSLARPISINLYNIISNNFDLIKLHIYNTGFYYQIEEYKIIIHNQKYTIFILHPFDKRKPLAVRLRHPDQHLIDYFKTNFNKTAYHISEIELTFDFITDYIDHFYELIKKSAYLKWPGAEFDLGFSDTHYFNNKRKARSKAAILYVKQKDVDSPRVRFELLFKREILKSNRIFNLNDLCKINYYLMKKYLEFRCFDFRLFKLRYNVQSKNCNQIVRYDVIEKQIIDLINNGRLHRANSLSMKHVRYSNLREHYFNKVFKAIMNNENFL